MKPKRRTAAERIAFHMGWDFAEMKDCRYQSTRFSSPAIYVLGEDYYASPSTGVMPPDYADMRWQRIGAEYGHSIYKATGAA